MPTDKSRVLTKRSYKGELEARELVDFLNGADPKEQDGMKRVQRIMECFHRLRQIHRKYPVSKWEKYKAGVPNEVIGKPRKPTELAEAERLLEEELYRYQMNPTVDSDGWPEWGVIMSDDMSDCPMGEPAAVETLTELARHRLLEKVQKCAADCGKWFYVRFPHQRFCSEGCKDKARRSRPGFKKKWRDYMRVKMRKLRKADKERQRRGLELVKKEKNLR